MDVGSLPQAAVGVEVAAGVVRDRLTFEISGTYWAPQSDAESDKSGATFHLLSADARAGYAWPLGRFHVGPLLAGGRVFGRFRIRGTVSDYAPTAFFGAVGAGGRVTWNATRLFVLSLGVETEIPLSRPSFVVLEPAPTSPSVVDRVSPVYGRGSAGAEISFSDGISFARELT